MIKRDLQQVEAFNATCVHRNFTEKLGKYYLDDQDVAYLKEIVKVLEPFEIVSRWMSGQK